MLKKRGGIRTGRKAQITLFVILALVLIIIFVLVYLFVIKKPFIEREFKEEAIPEEFKPVRDYVENCIHQVGIEAIKKMGSHGGYINPLDSELTPVLMRHESGDPTRYELVSLSGDDEDLVPYYLHVPGRSDHLNYRMGSLAPTIPSMEYQLSVYISREIPRCTGDFAALEEQGFGISADNDNIVTTSYIREDKLEFLVTYNINITKDGVKTQLTKHQNIIRFPYKRYYDLALSMMAAELLTQFLEGFTTSLIAYHSGLDFNLLPPVIEYTNLPYVITWSNSKVKNDFNTLLLSYTPALQVIGTRDYEPIDVQGDDVEASLFKSLTMEIFNESMPDTAITFFYAGNTLRMGVQPSRGDQIRPSIEIDEGDQYVPQSQFNTYRFYYDIAYPVIVEIRGYEPTTEIPEYSFLFALEENLIENKAVLAWNLGLGSVDWDYSYLNVTFDFPEDSAYDAGGNPIHFKPRAKTKSLFCDEDTWLSGDIIVKVADDTTGEPIEGATINYGCGDYEECWVGSTELSTGGRTAEWKGKLPVCQGGYLSISKEGYGSKAIMLSTQEGRGVLLTTQNLEKIRELSATLKKIEIQKIYTRNDDWEWEGGADSIGSLQDIDSSSEQVVLTITQTGFDAGTNPVTNTIIFGKDGVDKQEIKLVPGDYEITANLMDHDGITIPHNCSRVCSDRGFLGIGCTDHTYFPDSEVVLEPAPWGGVEIKAGAGATGVFRVTAAELDNNKELEFRVLKLPNLQNSLPAGACLDALNEMDKIDDYSAKYKTDIWPVFR